MSERLAVVAVGRSESNTFAPFVPTAVLRTPRQIYMITLHVLSARCACFKRALNHPPLLTKTYLFPLTSSPPLFAQQFEESYNNAQTSASPLPPPNTSAAPRSHTLRTKKRVCGSEALQKNRSKSPCYVPAVCMS